MKSTVPPPGIYVPAVLFFKENEDLDIPAIKSHVLRLAQGGVTGILVQGSIGEAQYLSHDERKETISLTRKTLDENGFQNVIIIAGCGAESARETKKLCTDAKDAGAAFVLVLTPSFWPHSMTRDNIINYHREIADYSPLPYMLYNFPYVTAGIDLDSDIILALSDHPNIVGIKLSCGDVGKLHRITAVKPPSEFCTLAGGSAILLQGLVSGSAGAFTALPNLVPKLHMKMYALYEAGNMEEAMKLQALLGQGNWATRNAGGIGAMKALVSKHFGYGDIYVRRPLVPITQLSGPFVDKLEELIAIEKTL